MTGSKLGSAAAITVLAIAAIASHARIIAWFTGQPVGGGGGAAVTVAAGPWRVGAAVDPDPPRQTGQRVRATVTDAAGAPIDGADVEVTYHMPAMGAMAEMKASFRARPAGAGGYEVTLDLPMGGTWVLWLRVATGASCAVARYQFTVGQPGLAPDGAGDCGDAASAAIRIAPARQRELGITTEPATRGTMTLALRAVGRITYDESRLSDVVLKVSGYVSDLRVRATGQAVRRGEPLLMLYSPELFAAQQDLLIARGTAQAVGGRSDAIVSAAEKKLELLGLSRAQIDQVANTGQPIEKLAFSAPASGTIIEKAVVDGAAVQAGMRLFRIAALDRIWVEADVFEADLARITPGMAATIEVGSTAARSYAGAVTFVYPYLDPQTRSGRVRIELANRGLELKPDMYATVAFQVALPDRLQVASAAIVYTGPRRLVFVDAGDGTLRPHEVVVGARDGERTEIVSGLAEGDRVVTSGNFLVAAESRLRGPTQADRSAAQHAGQHGPEHAP